jgi:hypothetical protein
MFRVQLTGEGRIRRMAEAVADGPDELRHQYDRSIRRAGGDTLREVKRAARRVPIRGYRAGRKRYRGPSTPKGLSTGTLSPRAQFVVLTAQVGAGRVPEYIESGKRWRHPIMGNRKAWASSQGRPWFEVTVRRNYPQFERRFNEAVERTARAIERDA